MESVLKFENVDANSQCVMFIPFNKKFNSFDKRIATVLTITVLNLSQVVQKTVAYFMFKLHTQELEGRLTNEVQRCKDSSSHTGSTIGNS